MRKKDRLDTLVDSYLTVDNDIKLLTESKDKIKKDIEKELNSRARAREETWLFPGNLTPEQVEEDLARLVGDLEYSIEDSPSGDWLVTIVFPSDQESIETEGQRHVVKRTVFTRGDDFDFDRLKELAPDVYDDLVTEKTSIERSISSKKINALLKERPELISILRRCTVRGKPQSRLTFKAKEEE